MRTIELLAPAKDLICGIEAINHGADAVYIGAPKFGARAAAGNSLDDIKTLCDYAHLYGARIYVALNTILKEDELEEAECLIRQLYDVGTDALIVQDMGITQLDLPPIPLHASTQTDNRTPEKVKFLQNAGFTQVVLARELSLNQIRAIHEQTTVPLEVFVHGALCVSYSGQCYLSAALSGRSANRGECAQYCRLPYTLTDADGKVIADSKHLLSLRDMNRSEYLEALMDAGASSFKIEGRLKDISYVKNITAFYRKKLDAILSRRSEYCRASAGTCTFTFEPVAEKSFNRGFTPFLTEERTADITAFDTPKSLGELVGTVKEIKGNSFTIAGVKQLNNGDGLAFFNTRGDLEGFRVNRVEANRIFPLKMPDIRPKMQIYRNFDQAFEKQLSKPSAERKLAVNIRFFDNSFGFSLEMEDETGARIVINRSFEKEVARKDQQDNIRTQLGKFGNTPFEVSRVEIDLSENWFAPSSLLADMRREGVEKLQVCHRMRYRRELSKRNIANADAALYPEGSLTYLGNVANSRACAFYKKYGVGEIAPAFELCPQKDVPLMFTKHCIRFSMKACPVYQKPVSSFKEPYYLLYKDTRLRLQFDCKNCQMLVYAENK
ncbi:peptidase U32 family protein [Parabacteroides bouchesdurhonensis]|uniref:peptidase U32 family protein n=1 Tax=Parabacteroides bouchesdurhonensis TaxID=1936995 RepID=UPI000C833AC5|nr:U32 family peptidase [Parabacteroides bouchesdurhonensis]